MPTFRRTGDTFDGLDGATVTQTQTVTGAVIGEVQAHIGARGPKGGNPDLFA